MIVKKKVGKLVEVKTEENELSLPSSPSKPSDRMLDYSLLIYGEKKIGKTSMFAYAESAFFMMFEPGGKALSIYQRPIPSWESFKKYVSLVLKSKQFKTVVIDTAEYSYKACLDHVCKKLCIEHPSEEDWGRGWQAVKDEYTREINRLLHSGLGIVFLSHYVEKEVKKRDGSTYHHTEPSLPGQAKEVLEGLVDIWAFYTYDHDKRILVIQGDDHIGAGHRVESQFRYVDGTPIRSIEMGDSPKEAYGNFVKAFENKLTQPMVKKVLTIKRKE